MNRIEPGASLPAERRRRPTTTIAGVEVLPGEGGYASRHLAIWLAQHPAEARALQDAQLVPIASALWADCWGLAAWDATRRVRQLRLYLACMFRRLRAVADRLEDGEPASDALRLNAQVGLFASEVVARLEEIAVRLDDAQAREDLDRELEQGSAYWTSPR